MDKEFVTVKVVIEDETSLGGNYGWADYICVEMPTFPLLKEMYGEGSRNELRMVYLMHQETLEIFYPHGDETPNEQKQQRRLIEAFQEVVEDTNGEALKDSPQEA
tara:strand:- start:689 stop:1003 length:315 start_codon:yes stop_codon:yes gene_type:complete